MPTRPRAASCAVTSLTAHAASSSAQSADARVRRPRGRPGAPAGSAGAVAGWPRREEVLPRAVGTPAGQRERRSSTGSWRSHGPCRSRGGEHVAVCWTARAPPLRSRGGLQQARHGPSPGMASTQARSREASEPVRASGTRMSTPDSILSAADGWARPPSGRPTPHSPPHPGAADIDGVDGCGHLGSRVRASASSSPAYRRTASRRASSTSQPRCSAAVTTATGAPPAPRGCRPTAPPAPASQSRPPARRTSAAPQAAAGWDRETPSVGDGAASPPA